MARSSSTETDTTPAKQGRFKQLFAVFQVTRRNDPALVWWMLLGLLAPIAIGLVVGLLTGHAIYLSVLGVLFGILAAMAVLARRAERSAYNQAAQMPGGTSAALQNLRKGWNVEQQPVAFDARAQDFVFRAVGRPGVVLITEGPTRRVNRLAEAERKRMARVLPNVPVHVVNAGPDEDQVELRKVSRKVMRLKPSLTKTEVSEVSKRLRALGQARLPIPQGVDPQRARPDRKATRGR